MSHLVYAIRLGFGQEGHGDAILVAEGATEAECEAAAREALQSQFGGLWVSAFRDTYIGSKTYLKKNFPAQRGARNVEEAIEGY